MQGTFVLSVVARGTIGAGIGRKTVVITNKDALINVARVDSVGDVFANGITLAPGEKMSLSPLTDTQERRDSDPLMVSESGTPSVSISWD